MGRALTDSDFAEALSISAAFEELVGLQGQQRTRFWGLGLSPAEHAKLLAQLPLPADGGPALAAVPAKLAALEPALAAHGVAAEAEAADADAPDASPVPGSPSPQSLLRPLSDAHRTLAFFNGMVDPEVELAGNSAQGVQVPLRILGFAWDGKALAAVLDGPYTAAEGLPAAMVTACCSAMPTSKY